MFTSHRPTSWDLYAHAVGLTGPVPTLIEWDADVPAWSTLKAEADHAVAIMPATKSEAVRHAATR